MWASAVFAAALAGFLTVSRWSASESSGPEVDASPSAESGLEVPLATHAPVPSPSLIPAVPVPDPTPAASVDPQPEPTVREPEVTALPPRALPSAVVERLPVGKREFDSLVRSRASGGDTPLRERLRVPSAGVAAGATPDEQAFDIEYTFDPELSSWVFTMLSQARVELGHVLVADARSGRMLAYVSTDPRRFPPTRLYPAASLVKVVTAAAALSRSPDLGQRDCRYTGSPYHLTPARIDPPRRGQPITFGRALAQSNNQCFAQLAVHQLGSAAMLQSIRNFGWLSSPGAGHPAGRANAGSSPYELGMLGSGLSGTEITPLHALQMALTLSDGTVRHPYWIERVLDAQGEAFAAPLPPLEDDSLRALTKLNAVRLRELMVDTTVRGTARRAFRLRNGRPLLGDIKVAAKTGSLSGRNPPGHYDWFTAVAPADDPRVAIAVLTVRGRKWYRSSSQLGAQVLKQLFCPRGRCRVEAADQWLDVPARVEPTSSVPDAADSRSADAPPAGDDGSPG